MVPIKYQAKNVTLQNIKNTKLLEKLFIGFL